MPDKGLDTTTTNEEQQGSSQKQSQSQKEKMRKNSPHASKHGPIVTNQEPHPSKHQNIKRSIPVHIAKQKPLTRMNRSQNPDTLDIMALGSKMSYEVMCVLLNKYKDEIGQSIVKGLLSTSGSALRYLAGTTTLSTGGKWTENVKEYVKQYHKAQERMEAMGRYYTQASTAMQSIDALNSPGMRIVREIVKYVAGRLAASALSIKNSPDETLHKVSTTFESIADASEQINKALQMMHNKLKAIGQTIKAVSKKVGDTFKITDKFLVLLGNADIVGLLEKGWELVGTGQDFSDFVMHSNSKVGTYGSYGILAASAGFILAAGLAMSGQGDAAYKVFMGSAGVGAVGLSAKMYDHHYMGPKPQEVDEQNQLADDSLQEQNEVDQPEPAQDDNDRFFWLKLINADVATWETGKTRNVDPNQQGYISKLIYGQQKPKAEPYKSGGARVQFGMGFNVFGKKLLDSKSHEFRLDWLGNFEYNNTAGIQVVDKLDGFGDAFKTGAVTLTDVHFTNKGMQSMGLKIEDVKIGGETLDVGEVSGSWSKNKGFRFKAEEVKANILGKEFDGTVNFGLDERGKFVAGAITVGSDDKFELIPGALTIDKFKIGGSINEKKQVSIGAKTNLTIAPKNQYFTANVGQAYVHYDQTKPNHWAAGMKVFDAQILGGRINIFFQNARLENNKLTIDRATLSYKKGGEDNGDKEALEGKNLFGDLENIFSIIKTLEVSATVGDASLSSEEGFKFGKSPSWELNELLMEYAGFSLSMTITKDEMKGELSGQFKKQFNIFKVLVETPIPAVPGLNLVGKAGLDARIGAKASLGVELDKERSKNAKNGDKYLKASGEAKFDAGLGLTAGLGASIGLANVASISGMMMGRFGVDVSSDVTGGATLVFNRHAADGKIIRQGERDKDKFRMHANAAVTPTFEISGGLFFNLMGQEFSLAQYSLARWELGSGRFAFDMTPDEEGNYSITPDVEKTTLNGKPFLKDRKNGFKEAAKKIPPERENYVKLRETFDQAEQALDSNADNYEELLDTLVEQGKGAEKQMLDTLSMMVAKRKALIKSGRKEDLQEAREMLSNINELKKDTKKVLMINYSPRDAVEYLHYYRTKKTLKAGFNKMLGKQFAIWNWRLLNRYAKLSLQADGVERVHNPGPFSKKQKKQAFKDYSDKVKQREQELYDQYFNVDNRLEQHDKEPEQQLALNQIEAELSLEVQSHVKEIQNSINQGGQGPRGKRTPDDQNR